MNELSNNLVQVAAPKNQQATSAQHSQPSKLAMVNNAADSYDTVDADVCEFETLRSLLKRIQQQSVATGVQGDVVPILNITKASTSDLRALLGLFLSDTSDSASRKEIADLLSSFIPVTTIQAPPTKAISGKLCVGCSKKPYWYRKKLSACSWCSRQFCSDCPLLACQCPRIGNIAPCQLCSECVKDITHQDASDWEEASIRFLAKCDERSIMASLGCAFVAIALGIDSQELLRKIAKKLHLTGQHTLAYSVLSLAISQIKDGDGKHVHSMKMHLLASSILQSMAKDRSKSWEERWSFALASKEVYVTALCTVAESDIEDVLDVKKKDEIDSLVHLLLKEKKDEIARKTLQHTQTLELLWKERDILKMLNFLKETMTDSFDITLATEESASLLAFKSFLKNKEHFLSSMLDEDRQALLFLQGVLKLKEEKLESALTDFESLAWGSCQSGISKENILSTYLYILGDQPHKLFSYSALKSTLRSGSKTLLFSKPVHTLLEERSLNLLFPSDDELTPPFTSNWPSLSVVGHNTRCHKKYEEAVMKLYREKKWSAGTVACAYLDAFPGCEHPAEMVVCYLHAAMWMTKNFGSKSKLSSKTLFAYKTVVMKLLQFSYAVSQRFLNPGMELYVNRLAVGIIRRIALVPDSKLVFTDQDSHFLHQLLKRLLRVSQLFPFWKPPSVSISEAVLLNIVSRNLHANFILELQFISSDHRPLTDLDLTYQLYENDLRGVLPLDNSSDSRAKSMDELLKAQGWSWNDVRQTMSTELCPRDQNGWIIQKPYLGVTQQYYEINGFVVNTDPEHPSIKLLVVEANAKRGRPGLFSQEDINTMLQLDLDDLPLYFSLDPPSDDLDKQYHPFQQWRYATEKVKGTEVLNTMFITDYLMKSFTVGSDVSSVPPFKQRPCKQGLTKNLPAGLQEALRSIHARGGFHSGSGAHRFWIETKEIKFDCQQNGSTIEYRFGKMEMQVKSRSLTRQIDGTLKDTDDEEDDPESPHATFARDMTANYPELSKHFPVFARLQELGKLQLFSLMLQSLLQNMREKSQGKGIEISDELLKEIQDDCRKQRHTNISAALAEMKQKVGIWPKAENRSLIRSKVDEVKSAIREEIRQGEERLYHQHGYHITIDNSDAYRLLDGVESRVIDAFRSSDEDVLTQITDVLRSSCNIPRNSYLKQYVTKWLASSDSGGYFHRSQSPKDTLVTYCCSYIPVPTRDEILSQVVSHQREKYQALSRIIDPLKKPHKSANSCKWVPAAIAPKSTSISYGGVALYIRAVPIRDGERLPRSRSETAVFIQKRSTAAPQTRRVNYVVPQEKAESRASSVTASRNNWFKDANSNGDDSSSSGGSTTRPPSTTPQRQSTSQTRTSAQTLNAIAKGSATRARLPVVASTFRGRSATTASDQLDRLRHAVDISRSPQKVAPASGGGGKRGGGGIGGGGGGGNGGGRGDGTRGGGGGGKGGGGRRGKSRRRWQPNYRMLWERKSLWHLPSPNQYY